MKRIFVTLGLLFGLATGVAAAQTRVGVSLSFGDPHFAGQVLLLPIPSRSLDRRRTALLPHTSRDRRAAASSVRARISSRLVARKTTKEAPPHRRLRSFSIFQQCAHPAIISFPQTPRHSSQLSRPRGESL
jgi:hypothetical protein